MGTDKKFYWLKFQKDFFKSLRIKKLRKLAGGDTFTIIYLKLQLFSLTTEGVLRYNGVFDSFEEEMAEEIEEDADNIKITVQYLISCGLMEQNGNEYYLPYVAENTGSECESAKRVRLKREKDKLKALQCNADVTECNGGVTDVTLQNVTCNTEKEKEIDIDIKEIYKEKSISQTKSSAHTNPEDINAVYIKWNSVIEKPKITRLSDRRRSQISKLIKTYGLDTVLETIDKVKESDFLSGRSGKDWVADFDFFLKPSKFLKILEGAYSNNTRAKTSWSGYENQTDYDFEAYEKELLGHD